MTEDERLLLDVSFAVVRAREKMQRCGARGDEEGRDEAFSRYQTIRDNVRVSELNRSWR